MDNEKDESPIIHLQEVISNKDTFEEFKSKLKKHRFDFDEVDEKGKTALIHFVEMSSSDHVWILLEYFADVNIKDIEEEKTALHYACKLGFKGVILSLLFFGAQTDLVDKDGKKPFDLCPALKDELEPIVDLFEKNRSHFIQLTRKRRKYLKKIFDTIDISATKFIDEYKLAK